MQGKIIHRLMGVALRPESIRVLLKIRLKERLDDDLHRHLHYPILDRREP
jgi:hypothetical protein